MPAADLTSSLSTEGTFFTLNQGMAFVCIMVASILSWFSIVLLETPTHFLVLKRQFIGLGFVIGMGVMGFAKLYFTLRYND